MIQTDCTLLFLLCPLVAAAQSVHEHAMPVNAVGGGIPIFCASPTATAVADGRWSAPATWSSGAVPSAGAKVLIPAGRQVAYDVESAERGAVRRGPRAARLRHRAQHEADGRHADRDGRGPARGRQRSAPRCRGGARGNRDRGSAVRLRARSRTGGQRHHRARPDQDARRRQDADLRAPDRRRPRVADDIHPRPPAAGLGGGRPDRVSRHPAASRAGTRARVHLPRRTGRDRGGRRRHDHRPHAAGVGPSGRARDGRSGRPAPARRQPLPQRRRRVGASVRDAGTHDLPREGRRRSALRRSQGHGADGEQCDRQHDVRRRGACGAGRVRTRSAATRSTSTTISVRPRGRPAASSSR